MEYQDLASDARVEAWSAIRGRVETSRAAQTRRFAGGRTSDNARMGTAALKGHCRLVAEGQEFFRMAMANLQLSAGGVRPYLESGANDYGSCGGIADRCGTRGGGDPLPDAASELVAVVIG